MKFVVLTKSAKKMNNGNFGNCVAGFNEQGEWVRLVSDMDGDSLSDSACRTFDCLDVINIDATACPIKYQQENMKLERLLGKIGKYTIEDVVDEYGTDSDSFCFVNNNYVLSEIERQSVDHSLLLIKAQNLKIYPDDKRIKARFTYKKRQYANISITDNRHKNPAEYDEAYIVVSLPSETGGYVGYYKFIAAVYPI